MSTTRISLLPASLHAALIGIVVAASPGVAEACRCAQRGLAEYFATATIVAVARVTGSEAVEATYERVVSLEPLKVYKGHGIDLAGFRTGLSSAACGVDVAPGTTLLVFAQIDPTRPGVATANTCNGTRLYDATSSDADFVDVAAADVPAHLAMLGASQVSAAGSDGTNALTGLQRDTGGKAQRHSVIGLVTLRDVNDGRDTGVPAYATSDGRCGRRMLGSKAAVATREIDDGTAATVVHELRDGRYRVALDNAPTGVEAWVPHEYVEHYWPLAALFENRLTYLTPDWDGRIWPFAGAGTARRLVRAVDKPAIEITGSTTVGDALWFEVRVFSTSPCSGEPPGEAQRGWVPAWNTLGELSIWYWSRGC